jgi:DMSO/TMAO reductase YedYZ molybdopterin-dependent catalytic subunit
MSEDRILAALPLHAEGVPEAPPARLRIDGMVEHPRELDLASLAARAQRTLRHDFECLGGWTVPDLTWQGVPLEELLAEAGVSPEARWIQASGAGWSVPVDRGSAADAIVALRLADEPVPFEHGGPFRLLVVGGACFTSVKWLDRLELRDEPAAHSARDKIRARKAAEGATAG